MKEILFLLLCNFMMTAQAAPERVINARDLDCNTVNNPGVCLDKDAKPFTGLVYSGTLGGARWERLYKDGEVNGAVKFFDKDGKFEREIEEPQFLPVSDAVDFKNLKCDKKTKMCQDKQGKPFTGITYIHHLDGGVTEIRLKEGKVNLPILRFNKNGIFMKRIVREEYLHLFVPNGIDLNALNCEKESGVCTYRKKPFTGTAFFYESLTKGHTETAMKDGRRVGIRKEFDKDGNFKIGYDKDLLVDEQGKPFTGYVIRYHLNGQLMSKIPYVNGKTHGFAKKYRENGFLDKEARYENGVINGDVKQYDYDYGFLRGKIPYKSGVQEGVAEEYDINGNITVQIPFEKGQAVGTAKVYKYSSDGKLFEEETIESNGNKVTQYHYDKNLGTDSVIHEKIGGIDVTKEYYSNGKLKSETRDWESDKITHTWKHTAKEYYPNGNLASEGSTIHLSDHGHVEFFQDGIAKEYYPNGGIKIDAKYDKGTGVEKEYFPDGKLKRETPYKAGKKEGIEKTYYMDGSPKKETPYVNDQREGWEKVYFYATGVLMEEILYEGDQHKEFKYYDIKGKPLPKPDILDYKQYEKFYEKADPKTMSDK